MICGYARNEPPLGWSVLIATRQGSFTSRYHSSPIAHCQAWTRLVFLYSIGTMPQPASCSMSLLNHFAPYSRLR